jgi:hypothetical protein
MERPNSYPLAGKLSIEPGCALESMVKEDFMKTIALDA